MTNLVPENIKIDTAHAMCITGLVVANKPRSILEIGLGGGRSTDAILAGIDYNQLPYYYTLVDNWLDWNGVRPAEVLAPYEGRLKVVDSDEKDFVFSTTERFDFIMSDGDHYLTDQWFDHVYDNLLNRNGILVYHDINLFNEPGSFPNLARIYHRCVQLGLPHHLFNTNSLPGEQCQRGLLVIFKH